MATRRIAEKKTRLSAVKQKQRRAKSYRIKEQRTLMGKSRVIAKGKLGKIFI